MPRKSNYKIAICFFILFFIGKSFAYEDGFGIAKKIEGEHFIIYYAPQVDTSGLLQQLNMGLSDKLLAGSPIDKKSFSEGLADTLDTLFTQVCNILDMHLYSFQGTIKICWDRQHLNKVYNNFFNEGSNRSSFYIHSLNTIYISAEDFKREILGHEIAHAVISHYFVVLPPEKIQEILAGYVEYQLRKSVR
jgi:hypothetical protein